MHSLDAASIPELPTLRLVAPDNLWRADTVMSLSTIARLVASGDAVTKTALAQATGLARSTISSFVDRLLRDGVLAHRGSVVSGTRRRPAERLEISSQAGLVLAVDFGARHVNLGIAELNQRVIWRSTHRVDVRNGPVAALDNVSALLEDRLKEQGESRPVRTIVVGIPARVYSPSGVAVRPNIMPGWDDFPIITTLGERFGAPALHENDVNLRALGEAAALSEDQRPILAIKIGTGIGAGFVDTDGMLFRGFDGSAGDIGHIPVRGAGDLPCTCGSVGCVEAAASLPSLVEQVKEADPSLIHGDGDDVVQLLNLLRDHNRVASSVVRSVAGIVGEVVAILCNTLNPRRIVIGSELTAVTDELLAGVRAVTYRTARPLATRNLIIGESVLGRSAGIAGAFVLGRQEALSPRGMARLLQ